VIVSTGCAATYRGTAVDTEKSVLAGEPGWVWVSGVSEVRQSGDKDCGAAALSAVLGYWGKRTTPDEIEAALHPSTGEGLRAGELAAYARGAGFESHVFYADVGDLSAELNGGRPAIVGVAKRYGQSALAHYEVVVGIHPRARSVLTLDPARGWRRNTIEGFASEWDPTKRLIITVSPR
jgi:ABC-type bacteriocin/lantibiotic exporter with double-glycine peptidase domain